MKTWTLILIVKAFWSGGGIAATNVTGFANKESCPAAFQQIIVPASGSKSGTCVEVSK